MGDAPLTVIVSSSAPIDNSAWTVAAKAPASSRPSRRTVLKPDRLNVTVYGPGRRSMMRY